jgi:6-phosphofructo-2-kinase / fructose-2,6-biphosphatase 3
VHSTFLLLLETLDFKFVLKRKDGLQCIFEEGPNRSLGCENNEVEMRTVVFKLNEKDTLDCKIWVETEMLSPFDLATSWRAHQGNLQPSGVRGTHDAVMNAGSESIAQVWNLFDCLVSYYVMKILFLRN